MLTGKKQNEQTNDSVLKYNVDVKQRTEHFTNLESSDLFYNKELIKGYTNYKWTLSIKEMVMKRGECDLGDGIQNGELAIQPIGGKILFPRYSTRYMDSKLMCLLHGNSKDFRKFANSVATINKPSPLCRLCPNKKDDAYHQLFECQRFNCHLRNIIPKSENRKLFALRILMSPGKQHLKALRDMACIIFG